MDATNISINQSSGVSINIEALQEIKKHFNVDTLVSSFLQSGVQTLCASGRAERRFQVSMLLPRLYRKELRLVRTLSRMMDGKVGNMWIGGCVAACVYLLFIYA